MIKCGIDILQVSRCEDAVSKMNFADNVFTDAEKEYMSGKLEAGQIRGYKFFECVAGLFCAKEAVLKALGVGIIYIGVLKDVEIGHEKSGEPFAKIYGKLAEKFPKHKGKKLAVSISHDGGFAIAECVIDR